MFSHFHTGLQGPTMQFPYNKTKVIMKNAPSLKLLHSVAFVR